MIIVKSVRRYQPDGEPYSVYEKTENEITVDARYVIAVERNLSDGWATITLIREATVFSYTVYYDAVVDALYNKLYGVPGDEK